MKICTCLKIKIFRLIIISDISDISDFKLQKKLYFDRLNDIVFAKCHSQKNVLWLKREKYFAVDVCNRITYWYKVL